MSKLLKQYENLKKENSDLIYIFRFGIFYNIINEDAKILNNKLGLKLTSLSPEIIKCGFPISSINKYINLLEKNKLKYKIIDNLPQSCSTIEDYSNNIEFKKIINEIKSIDINNINSLEALNILNNIQTKLNNL